MKVPTVMELLSSAIRGCIVAPPGRKLVVADLSNIEGRALAWLAGEQWKLQAFRDFDAGAGPDLYKLAYAKSFGVRPEDVTKDQRQVGKVQELALGYEGGVGAFVTFAAAYSIDLDDLARKVLPVAPEWALSEARQFLGWTFKEGRPTFGLSDDAFVACDAVKRSWRGAHGAVQAMWGDLKGAAQQATEWPEQTVKAGIFKVRRDGNWLRIGLPSGRALCYPSPQVVDGTLTYMGVNQYSRKWSRLKTYGGKLCIAGGTPTLTRTGWTPIEHVRPGAEVWDGENWVPTGGAVHNGAREVVDAFGAWMTPDHLVLTTKGWRDASQSTGLERAACRLPDGVDVPGFGRSALDVGSPLRLRHGDLDAGIGTAEAAQAGDNGVLRMPEGRNHCREAADARDEQAPGVRGLVLDARAVPAANASGVAQLRRPGHHGVRRLVGVLRSLLGGHGRGLRPGAGDRPEGQQRGLLPRQLPLGDPQGAGQEHPAQPQGERQDGGAVVGRVGGGSHDAALPACSQGAFGQADGGPGRIAEVFDLVNCGPLHRFAVWAGGAPLIVHNCENATQAVARDVMAHNMPLIEAAGYQIVLTVHDEVICEAPDAPEFNAAHLSALLSATPPWAPDLPLAAAGFEAYRYRKD